MTSTIGLLNSLQNNEYTTHQNNISLQSINIKNSV